MMKSYLYFVGLGLLSGSNAFQFMSNFKVTPPKDLVMEEKVKEKFGDKKLVVITGTSSGLGRKTAQALIRSGEYHVVGAVRDIEKMEVVAELDGFDTTDFTPIHVELNSFESVRKFCNEVKDFKMTKPIDRLICNAGIYQPSLPHAKWSMDGHEQTMQVNYLSHFLMISEFLEDMRDSADARVIMVGSVTGNDNTVGGGGVYPIADLKDLDGFKAGFQNPIEMADGYRFIGAKAYKDSKLCLMMLSNILHSKYHKLTGISFSSIYPGCIAESPLFREKRKWFRQFFPVFMKYITGGFVSEQEAGQRLFQVTHDPRCSKSGVYWSWNGGPREDRGLQALEKEGAISGGGGAGGGWDSIFENDQSAKVNNLELGVDLFRTSNDITGSEWPCVSQVRSPCPTLNVIGAISKSMIDREELKRMEERPGFYKDGRPIKITKRKKVQRAAEKVVGGVFRRTVGRTSRFLSRRLLGKIPEEAIQGSFQTYVEEITSEPELKEVSETYDPMVSNYDEDDQLLLEKEIAEKIALELEHPKVVKKESQFLKSMKSDEELFEEVMSTKSEDTSSHEQQVA